VNSFLPAPSRDHLKFLLSQLRYPEILVKPLVKEITMLKAVCLSAFVVATMPLTASAETATDFLQLFASEARRNNTGFSGFSSARGAQFFATAHSDWSCASCHSRDPLAAGEHIRTGKSIEPLAPSANPQRFSNPRKVEKWFRRNCNDVLNRSCTAQEKGDVLAYLLSLQP
jgi:hypothetical protein